MGIPTVNSNKMVQIWFTSWGNFVSKALQFFTHTIYNIAAWFLFSFDNTAFYKKIFVLYTVTRVKIKWAEFKNKTFQKKLQGRCWESENKLRWYFTIWREPKVKLYPRSSELLCSFQIYCLRKSVTWNSFRPHTVSRKNMKQILQETRRMNVKDFTVYSRHCLVYRLNTIANSKL